MTGFLYEWTCEWVRPGAPGVARYAGTETVMAPNRESAIERTRIKVADGGCFRRFEIDVTSAVRK